MNFPVVGIGASAGGLEALKELIESVPADLQITCVVILHLDPSHESFLADILSKQTEMKVIEAKDGMVIEARHIYTIPPNSSLVVVDGHLHTESRGETTGLFLPIDRLFRALAENYQDKAVGIVLSGTGSDGTQGLQAIKSNGGTTFAQEEKSAKFASMPHSAIASGAVDFVLSPTEIAGHLAKLVHQEYWSDSDKPRRDDFPSDTIKTLFRIVHKQEGIDFSSYKSSTVNRRILRRMAVSLNASFFSALRGRKVIRVCGQGEWSSRFLVDRN